MQTIRTRADQGVPRAGGKSCDLLHHRPSGGQYTLPRGGAGAGVSHVTCCILTGAGISEKAQIHHKSLS